MTLTTFRSFAMVLLGLSLASCTTRPAPSAQRPAPRGYQPGQVQTPKYQPAASPQGAPSASTPAQAPIPRPNPLQMGMAKDAPWIHATSYVLMDATTGRVLSAKNPTMPRGAASTQKLLTALIVIESGDLDRQVRVEPSDVMVEPTKLGIKPREVYTRRQLLTALLIKSCNDVANVLARDNAGSVTAFTARMNQRARSLGASQSYFKNPHGLTAPGQLSSAYDMARISMAAYRNPVIRDITRRRSYAFRFNSGRVLVLENTNKILPQMLECNGMKTGYTAAAGRCLVSTASRNGRHVILVQLGTKTTYIWDDGIALMNWGLNQG